MKKLSLFISIILFSLFITKLFAGKHYASGKARVVDGDTIVIKKERIRFGGINSPERKEVGYKLAKDKPEIPAPIIAIFFIDFYLMKQKFS